MRGRFTCPWKTIKTMKKQLIRISIALALFSCWHRATAQGTAITYQGRLSDGTNAPTGNYDMKFSLFDAATLGNQIGTSVVSAPTGVTNGLFTVLLDFGSNYPGPSR